MKKKIEFEKQGLQSECKIKIHFMLNCILLANPLTNSKKILLGNERPEMGKCQII